MTWVADGIATQGRAAKARRHRAARAAAALVGACKPRIVALFALTVLVASVLAGAAGTLATLAVTAAASITVAGAAALNNYLERDVDARMARTRRRPTAAGALPARVVLAFGLGATLAGIAAVWASGGAVAAGFAAAGAAYYVLAYTMVFKPRTALSSLPGSLAGIFPALIGWSAAGGGFSAEIVFLCAVIACWSPPHFWALSLALRDEYEESGIPTPSVSMGEAAAARLILAAAAALVALSVAPVAAGLYGPPYLLIVAPAGLVFLLAAAGLVGRRSRAAAWLLHKISGPYLAAILLAMVVERLVNP
jgi:protoheme IX farnesyltransferase